MNNKQSSKNLFLASPRGFCAGVERAISIVEKSIEIYGKPIYVKHEIVHNKHVVERLSNLGAVFIENIDEVPIGSKIVFSAHGVAEKVKKDSILKDLNIFDATCPLVTKVHLEAKKLYRNGYHILLIGHDGHPEIEGTKGQVPFKSISLVENIDQAKKVYPPSTKLAWLSQTTLSVDDTKDIVNILKSRFPEIMSPGKDDICYATSNRQLAVKEIAPNVELMLIVGSENSSNSKRLVEVSEKAGCKNSFLISDASQINWKKVNTFKNIGLSSGASAPENLIDEIRLEFSKRFDTNEIQKEIIKENVYFKLPKVLDQI